MNPSIPTVSSPAAFVEGVLSGSRLALARLLTEVENSTPKGQEALNQLFPHTGQAHLIGVTGSPGTGKSSLVNQLARHYRRAKSGQNPCRVAIVAVDPSSPFTGGAILGDRVRMRDLASDPGVFIRSMASRGNLGGLARTSADVVQVFDAAGYEVIFIETVGAGQSEVDIAKLAHTTLVVEAPGLGDDVQALKAGILEIADILVVNKADRPGAEHTARTLRAMLEMAHPSDSLYHHPHCPPGQDPAQVMVLDANGVILEGWQPLVMLTTATLSTGVEQLYQKVLEHAVYLKESGEWHIREQARIQVELDNLIQAMLMGRWRASVSPENYQQMLDNLIQRDISPYQAVKELLEATTYKNI